MGSQIHVCWALVRRAASTCAEGVLLLPGCGGGATAAAAAAAAAADLCPWAHGMLTWPADQSSGVHGILQLHGSGEGVAHRPPPHRLGRTGQLAWTLHMQDSGGQTIRSRN